MLPGEYMVRLTVPGQVLEETFTVRLDPRIKVSEEDLDVYYREIKRIIAMQRSVSQAAAQVQALDGQLAKLEASDADAAIKSDVTAIRKELRTVRVGLTGDPRDPENINLGSKLNWLNIQVGNYTGRPTDAQIEWIGRFDEQLKTLLARLAAVQKESLPKLNARLKEAKLQAIILPPDPFPD